VPGTDDDGDEPLATDVENSQGADRAEEPTRELPSVPTAGAEDHCTNCGAPLAHDQRYCVECGERRGPSRFPTGTQSTTEVRTTKTRTVPPRRRAALSSGVTLVLGVGVLLLAIGLGVLIGSLKNNTTTTKASAPQVITVQGGGAAATTSTGTTTGATTTPGKTKAKAKAKAATTAAPPPAVQKKATQAAGKVLGNSKNLPPPTVTTGGACSNGQAGCSGGKFNGNFFGQ
jgi:hypothetical protein